tara:strand:- start:1030 stop:1215 length:186 start_codon:yes stop_codon:yes gene_type:complete
MAVPKQKHSKARTRKRRAQWKLRDNSCITKCSETGQIHKRHKAYEVDGVLYFKGKILPKNK